MARDTYGNIYTAPTFDVDPGHIVNRAAYIDEAVRRQAEGLDVTDLLPGRLEISDIGYVAVRTEIEPQRIYQ